MNQFLLFVSCFLIAMASRADDRLYAKSMKLPVNDNRYMVPAVLNGILALPEGSIRKFTVYLETINSDNKVIGKCTGVIIDFDIILSAGHCIDQSGVKVRVSFGLGGEHGFTHRLMAETYHSFAPSGLSAEIPIVNGVIQYDSDSRKSFEDNIAARTRFYNFSDERHISGSIFSDFAIIKVSRIPSGYVPIPIYSGSLNFRHKVLIAGYGYSSYTVADNTVALRWSEGQLVGHFTMPDQVSRGYQVFSPTRQQACYGDSGGPLIIENAAGEYELLALNVIATNFCANANWYMNPTYFEKEIIDAINTLRRQTRI